MLFFGLSLLLCLTTLHGKGQEAASFVRIEHIGLEDGLPDRRVISIAQDKKGLIWVLTPTDIYRYDGYTFTPLQSIVSRKDYPAFLKMRSQPDGEILLHNQHSIWALEPEKGLIYPHPIDSIVKKRGFSIHSANLQFGPEGQILLQLNHEKGEYLVQYGKSGDLTMIDSLPATTPTTNYSITLLDSLLFWGHSQGGIRIYNSYSHTLIDSIQLCSEKNDFQYHHYYVALNSDSLIIADLSSRPAILFDRNTRESTRLPYSFDLFTNFCRDKAGNTWIGNYNQLLMVTPDMEWYDYYPLLAKVAEPGNTRNMIQGDNQQLWIPSENGWFQFEPTKQSIKHYLSQPSNRWGKTTRGLLETETGEVIVRCESCGMNLEHIFYLLPQTGNARRLSLSSPEDESKLIRGGFQFVYEPVQRLFYTQSHINEFVSLDFGQMRIQRHPVLQPDMLKSQNGIHRPIASSSKGGIWAGKNLGTLYHYAPNYTTADLVFQNKVEDASAFNTALLEDSQGKLWMGSQGALFCINPTKGDIVKHFEYKEGFSFKPGTIYCLFEDQEQHIWVGTEKAGLLELSPQGLLLNHFTVLEGLAHNTVAAILPQGDDKLWVSTFNGLSCLDKSSGRFINFFVEDGLSHNEFNITSAFIDSRGRYYFGGMNGVNAFYPDQLLQEQRQSTPKAPVLIKLHFYNAHEDSLYNQWLPLGDGMDFTFSPQTAWFEFHFSLSDYSKPEANRFQTWLEGFEPSWSAPTFRPFIRYNNLPAGSYTLHIRAANPKGLWSPEELRVRIIIKQVFYKSWWFLLLCILLAGCIAYLILRYRFLQKLKLERMRTQIASDLHDEVGSSLSYLNFLIGSFDMKNAPERTAAGIEKSKAVMKKTASDIRDVVWAIDARRDKAGDLLDRMEDFAYDMLSSHDIQYHLDISGIERNLILSPVLRQNIYLIYKEAINNIAKHSSADRVNITLRLKGRQLNLNIHDNGNNLNQKKVKGQGLENMAMRAKRIGGDIQIESSNRGFRVRLQVSLS